MKKEANILFAPKYWFKGIYNWTIHWSRSKNAPWALFGIAFMESSFFPIPPDVLLVSMVIAHKRRWLRYAGICTLGSVAGALLGYLIGWGLYESVGKFIVEAYKLQQVVQIVGQKYQENAFFTVFTAAFTPIPYKVITICAGLFRISVPILIIASIIGRSARFFIVSGVLRIFGRKIKNTVARYFDILSIVFVVLLIGSFFLLKVYFKK